MLESSDSRTECGDTSHFRILRVDPATPINVDSDALNRPAERSNRPHFAAKGLLVRPTQCPTYRRATRPMTRAHRTTEERRGFVKKMASFMLKSDEIACLLRISSKTLQRRYRKELDEGRAEPHAS